MIEKGYAECLIITNLAHELRVFAGRKDKTFLVMRGILVSTKPAELHALEQSTILELFSRGKKIRIKSAK